MSHVPRALAGAIQRAARRYGVPASTLAGIWRIESGSTFPNPAVNSSGYGGLFGTHKWNASTQAQANYAASILSNLLRQHGGNMGAALSAYSGGGYTHVAGGGVSGRTITPHPARVRRIKFPPPPAPPHFSFEGRGGNPQPSFNLSKKAVALEGLQALATGSYSPEVGLQRLMDLSFSHQQTISQQIGTQPPMSTKALPGVPHVRFEGGNSPADQRAFALVRHSLGTPYVWGGSRPGGFDCSGLLQWAWGKIGVRIPRTSQEQWKAGRAVGFNQLRLGDAVFFKGYTGGVGGPGHVGFYIGNGKMIEAPGSGMRVRIRSVRSHGGYMGARRFA